MSKRKILFYSLLGLSGTLSWGQSVPPNGDSTFSSVKSFVQWTLGQTIIATSTSLNLTLTQEFNQTELYVTTENADILDNFEFTLYPNPTDGVINVKSNKSWDYPSGEEDVLIVSLQMFTV